MASAASRPIHLNSTLAMAMSKMSVGSNSRFGKQQRCSAKEAVVDDEAHMPSNLDYGCDKQNLSWGNRGSSDKFRAARHDQLQLYQHQCEVPMLRAPATQAVRSVLSNHGKYADLNAFISKSPTLHDGTPFNEGDGYQGVHQILFICRRSYTDYNQVQKICQFQKTVAS